MSDIYLNESATMAGDALNLPDGPVMTDNSNFLFVAESINAIFTIFILSTGRHHQALCIPRP